MTTHSISITNNYNVFREHPNEPDKELKGRNLRSVNTISVISASDELGSDENRMVTEQDESALKCVCKIITYTIAIVGLSVLAVVPWATIPRTNSIIYQSHWMEILLPSVCLSMLLAGSDMLIHIIFCLVYWIITPKRSVVFSIY